MKKSSLLIALMLATLAGGWTLAPAVASADTGCYSRNCYGRGPGDEGRHMPRMAEILGLSTEQQTKIKEILQQERQAVAPLQAQLQTSREQLREAAQADTFDEAAVRKLAETQAATRTELTVARLRTRHQVQAVLTPEQRDLAKRLRPLFREQRGHHGHHGHRGRGFGPNGPWSHDDGAPRDMQP